jgi:hypothetical protein
MATMLRHAAYAPTAAARKRALAGARRVARETLLPWQIADGPAYDDLSRRSPNAFFRIVADREMRRGQLALASHILDSLNLLTPQGSLESGRLLSQRAALSWFIGYRELSQVQYQQLARLGRRLREPELAARAHYGLSGTMWAAGNWPACVRLAKRAAKLAGTRISGIAASALQTLSVDAMFRGDLDSAVTLAWRSCQFSRRSHALNEAALVNAAQILVDAGYPAEARAVATHVLERPKNLFAIMPVIGSYALASAALGDAPGVEHALSRVLELTKSPVYPRLVADALQECAFALQHIGRQRRASQIRDRAIAMAKRFGFHDIAYLAENNMRRGVATKPLATNEVSRALVAEIAEWEAPELSVSEAHAR